jgi:hypothetical protein
VHANPAAETGLLAYLNAALVTRLDSTHVSPDSLNLCPPVAFTSDARYLALARILWSHSRGDSAQVTAQVTTVGHIAETATVDVIHQQVRVDTLAWLVLRDHGSGRWAPCGYATLGTGFARMIAPPGARWDPPTASWQSIARLVDSIRTA